MVSPPTQTHTHTHAHTTAAALRSAHVQCGTVLISSLAMQPLLLPPRTPPPVRAIPPLTAAASLAAVAVLMAWLAGAARPQAPAFQALSTAVGARRVRPAHSLTSGRRAVGHAARSSAPRAMPRAPAPPAVPHAPAPTAAPFQPSALIAMWHVALGIAVAGVAMLVSRLRRPARPTVQTMAAIAPDDLLGPTQGDELPEAAPEAPEDWRSCGVEEVVAHARDTDQFGLAALQYALGVSEEDLYTETNISELDVLPIKYLFRSYDEVIPPPSMCRAPCIPHPPREVLEWLYTVAGGGVTPPPPRDALEGGVVPRFRAPSLCPATVSLTPNASLNGMCNRQ